MSNYHHFNKSFSAKRALALVCLLCVGGFAAWAQSTRLYIDTSAATQIALTKVYDGTTTSTVTVVGTPLGILDPSHNVTLLASANYVDANVGGIKMVVVEYSLTGTDAALYLPPFNDTLWAAITPRPLSVSGTMIDSAKVYNRSTVANIQRVGTLSGVVTGDNVFPSAMARYADANVGVDKTVTVTYSLYGGNTLVYSNYIIPEPITLTADITPLELYAPEVTLAASKIYDGTVNCPVTDPGTLTGVYSDDEVTYSVSASFFTTTAAENKPVLLSYNLYGPQSMNYIITDTSSTAYRSTILPRPLGAQGAVVRTTKTYDGTVNAVVVYPAFPANYIDGETIEMNTTATFDSPEIGCNKTITLHYTLVENYYSSNYTAPDDEIYTTDGWIIPATVLDSAFGVFGIEVNPDGYCPDGEATMTCHITQGIPSYYIITYPTESSEYEQMEYSDTITYIGATSFIINFNLPQDFPAGQHTATIVIGNEAGDEIVTNCDFVVNLPNTYLVQVFNDVVSIDNRTEQFNTFQWYKNGKAIEGATLPYYQEPGGLLEGSYSVKVNGEHMICPLEFYYTPSKSMKVCPNPIVNSTQVKIVGSDQETHVLTLYNSYGTPVLRTTFSGSEYQLDMSNLPRGIYMLSVDDMNTKTVKL